jgi:hypothetical protein
MPTERSYVDVLGMPWRDLVELVAVEAAAGDDRARRTLRHLVEEERDAHAEGREPGDDAVILRLSTLPVLRPTHGSRSA